MVEYSFEDVVYWFDVVTIFAAFAQLVITVWLLIKVDDATDDIDEMQDDVDDLLNGDNERAWRN